MSTTLKEAIENNLLLLSMWSPKNNSSLLLKTTGSNVKALWICLTCEQETQIPIVKKISNPNQCSVCSGKKIVSGVNDLQTLKPSLMGQWSKSNTLDPTQISVSSAQEVTWECEAGHKWKARISERTRLNKATNCPDCYKTHRHNYIKQNPYLLPDGENVHTFLKKSFISPVNPTVRNVTQKSRQICKWKCDNGHEWEARPGTVLKNLSCPECVTLNKSNTIQKAFPHLALQWHPTKNSKTPSEVTTGSAYKATWFCDKGHEWETYVYSRTSSLPSNCPDCSNNSSTAEDLLFLTVSSLLNGVKTVKRIKTIISPFELDIYVPEKKIAIEFNGLYWHSEKFKNKTYHYDKWLACKEKGIQLIQVWEDDWNRNPELVKQMLAHKLVVSNEPTVYARKTKIAALSVIEAKKFFNKNHIQQYASGSYYIGLKDINNNIVAAMCLKKEKINNFNIIRYATACNVPGGFTKILKHVENIYSPDSFTTFSDNSISNGMLYETNGFIIDKELPVDYSYIVNKHRVHKFNYRLKKFKQDPDLFWKANLSEKELAVLNNLIRIWDAGKIKYKKILK